MKLISFVFLSLIVLISCTRKNDVHQPHIGYTGADSLKNCILLKEKTLKNYYQDLMTGDKSIDTLPNQLINSLLKEYQIFYKTYPKDTLTPYYLDKIHQLFTQEKQYTYAVDWVDTLLHNYPSYRNKSIVLYSAATTSDLYLMDTNRVKRYYQRILIECPKLKIEVKNQITHRLKYLKIPYLEYVSKKQGVK
jgi:hypothetical protein